jgi:predicted protein tyrosine phosphatase
MAQVRSSAAAAIGRALLQGTMDDLTAMGQFRQVHSVMNLAVLALFDAHQGHPGGLGTGIKL